MSRYAMGFRAGLVAAISVSVLLVAGAADAQTMEPVNLSNSGFAQSAQIAVDSTGKIINVVWEDKSAGNSGVLYSCSTDGGRTFFAPKNLSQSGNSRDPRLAVDSGGNINVAWREDISGSYALLYTRSADGGASFTTPKQITGPVSAFDLHMAVDSKGNIGVLYVDVSVNNWSTDSVVYAHSSDGGSTFSSRTLQSGSYPFPGRPALAIGTDDSINVAWVYDQDGNGQIYFSRSGDGGANFNGPIWIARGGIDDVKIAATPNGDLAVIWYDNGWSDYGASAGTYVARSSDGGLTWSWRTTLSWGGDYYSYPIIVADKLSNFDAVWVEDTGGISFVGSADFSVWAAVTQSGTAVSPQITSDPTGTINIVWSEGPSENFQVFYSRSTDRGTSFSPPENLSNTLGNVLLNQIATDTTGKVFAVWTDWSVGDVFFAFYPDTLSTEFKLTVADGCANSACGNFGATGSVTSPAGLDCTTFPCSATFARGTELTLAATPAAGATFAGWAGTCSGTAECTVQMSASRMLSARFELPHFRLDLTRFGNGTGTITSDPAGINCGAACSADYAAGTVVTLTAVPAQGAAFLGWSGDCSGTGACTVAMDARHSVSANFGRFTLTLKLFTIDTSGRVTSDPPGIDCTMGIDWTVCTAVFTPGTVVNLTAIPFRSSFFGAWGGACSGSSTVCTVTMNSDLEVRASFHPKQQWSLQLKQGGSGTGTISSNFGNLLYDEVNTFYEGETVVLTANAAAGSLFTGWSSPCSGTGTCSIAGSTDQFYGVIATFETIPDRSPPVVSISEPASTGTVSGSAVAVTATATDNVGVVGIQFKVDGANLGAEDTIPPYKLFWDTTQFTNGTHTVMADARDAAGNHGTASVVVTVSNTLPRTPPRRRFRLRRIPPVAWYRG